MTDQYGQQPGNQPYGQQPGNQPYGQQPVPTGPDGAPPLWAPWYGISFPNAVRRFFTKYVRFDGRASRSEYWWWFLANFIVTAVLSVVYGIGAAMSGFTQQADSYGTTTSMMTSPSPLVIIAGILILLWGLATIIPTLAISWRRLHDGNFAGPLWFLGLIPFVGGIILLVLYLLPSKPEGARFDRPDRG